MSSQSGAEVRFDLGALLTASATDVGQVRTVNQDACGEARDLDRGMHLLIVADGMGGHRGGEVASQIAVEVVEEVFRDLDEAPGLLLKSALEAANIKIFEAANHDLDLAGMGTTGVGVIFTGEDRAWIAHVGDSRAYLLRGNVFTQLTGDHSVVGELVRRGQLTSEEARVHPQSNEILRALGTQPDVDVEMTPIDVQLGDRLLLCSDGLSGMLPDAEIAGVLARHDAETAVSKLIEMANEAGGSDNITVQIAIVPESGPSDDAEHESSRAGSAETDDDGPGGSWLPWIFAAIYVGVLIFLLANGSS